ncbi:MAG: hypothetical protein RLZ55_1556 [Actinomycetota bacterium]|jgi:uncharacterized protein
MDPASLDPADRLAGPLADQLLVTVAGLAGDATAAVAFSGGADSALALGACVRALGSTRTLAVTAVSPSLSTAELDHARRIAHDLGVVHLFPNSDELSRPGYAENSPARCFHCKTEVISVVFRAAAATTGRPVVIMTGTNADDLTSPHRPGIAAAQRLGAVTPLASLSKAEVRAVSRLWGLPTWDKPAQACLASRLAYGVAVSAEALQRVQRAEAALRTELKRRDWQVRDLRVRDLGDDRASIEVDADVAEAVAATPAVTDAVRATGFDHVEVDPRGFRSGSMNDALQISALTGDSPNDEAGS